MSTKLLSPELEKKALRAYCSPTTASRCITKGLTEEHFATEVCRAAFARVLFMQNKRNKRLTWADLLVDPTLPASVKNALRESKAKPPATEERALALFDNLDSYRKLRGLNTLSREISEALMLDIKQDPAALLESVAKKFSAIAMAAGAIELTTVGKGENYKPRLHNILSGKTTNFLPTGFRTFDDRAHGVEFGSFMMISSTAGGGKSTVMQALAENFALQGASVLQVPLEMGQDSLLQRSMAHNSGITLTKILHPGKLLTKKDKLHIEKKYASLSRRIRKVGGRLTTMSSDQEDISIDTVLTFAKTAGYRVVLIDYIGLLAGTDGDDQVRALARITRKSKLWAMANRAIVVMAAQLSDEGRLKYSRAMEADSNNLWTFQRSPTDKENKIVRVQQLKSRQNEDFSFELFFDSSTMTVRDLTPDEAKRVQLAARSTGSYGSGKEGQQSGGKGKPVGKKTGFSSKYAADIT